MRVRETTRKYVKRPEDTQQVLMASTALRVFGESQAVGDRSIVIASTFSAASS
jgi:hypothetical protein